MLAKIETIFKSKKSGSTVLEDIRMGKKGSSNKSKKGAWPLCCLPCTF